MYKNFKEYWEAKKGEFALRGIDEASAFEIWTDACDTFAKVLEEDWDEWETGEQ
jgi:hypothetical protein